MGGGSVNLTYRIHCPRFEYVPELLGTLPRDLASRLVLEIMKPVEGISTVHGEHTQNLKASSITLLLSWGIGFSTLGLLVSRKIWMH